MSTTFYIELPVDEFGNRMLTNSVPQVIEAEKKGDDLNVIAPEAFATSWPIISPYGWIECDGPARVVTHDEREAIIESRRGGVERDR